jgi:hypothetical protein
MADVSTLPSVELGVLGPLQVRQHGAAVMIQAPSRVLRRTLGDGFVVTGGVSGRDLEGHL